MINLKEQPFRFQCPVCECTRLTLATDLPVLLHLSKVFVAVPFDQPNQPQFEPPSEQIGVSIGMICENDHLFAVSISQGVGVPELTVDLPEPVDGEGNI